MLAHYRRNARRVDTAGPGDSPQRTNGIDLPSPTMIENYTDHAANERTFLAWLRTAIAIVGFGLGAEQLARTSAEKADSSITGMVLLVSGMLLILGAATRFLITRSLIRSKNVVATTPLILDIALAVILAITFATLASFGIHLLPLVRGD